MVILPNSGPSSRVSSSTSPTSRSETRWSNKRSSIVRSRKHSTPRVKRVKLMVVISRRKARALVVNKQNAYKPGRCVQHFVYPAVEFAVRLSTWEFFRALHATDCWKDSTTSPLFREEDLLAGGSQPGSAA